VTNETTGRKQMAVLYPVIGQWFSRPNGTMFEVEAGSTWQELTVN